MVAYGTHEAEEYFVKSGKLEKQTINRVWDIYQPSQALNSNDKEIFYTYNTASEKYYHVLHDKGSVGVFLKGFFGYNSNPNWIEFILWLGSILFGLKMWSSFYRIQK
jgi:high-affinity Fe2+/Pb2+ permease